MTHEEQADLKRQLVALDSLLAKLAPDDEFSRLAMDPKRQGSAAMMVGTIHLARGLLFRIRATLESPPATNGVKPKGRNPGIAGRVVQRLTRTPGKAMQRNELVHVVNNKEVGNAGVYAAISKLEEQGRVKVDKDGKVWLLEEQ